MRVLVACEFSGRVRDSFLAKGHDAISCDLRPTESPIPGRHHQGDVREILNDGFDLLVAHPECTYNCLSGIQWFYHPDDTHLEPDNRRRHPRYPDRLERFAEGAEFFELLQQANIPKICIENSKPHGLAMARFGKPTQTVQPYHFGEPYTKGAALWLKNLPPLVPRTSKSDFPEIIAASHMTTRTKKRELERSRTYQGIANAMAEAWG